MWPMFLNMTRDECRLTLRRLELEAYSNMINVFRAQGALEDNRKKLLEELRAVLHISQDRHSAEARRASNDQLLATVAEQLSGPNTSIAWICEGRRRVPLLPRGVAQTAYTEIADKAAEAAAAENKEIQKRLASEKLNASIINEQEMQDAEGYNQESTLSASESTEDAIYPIAMEDQTVKLWDTELLTRKRKPEGGGPDALSMPPVKNMRNIPANSHQKHLNLSQLYSRFSQPASSKSSGHSKHSYNQVSKVSTSKSSERAPRATPAKPRKPKTPKTPKLTKAQLKKAQEKLQASSPGSYNASVPLEYAGPPNSFQASYAQAVLGPKSKSDFLDDIKPKGMASPGMVTDSPTMQLLTQPATLPHELEIPENAHPDDHSSIQTQAQSTPLPKQTIPAKPDARHLIIKNKSREIVSDKKPYKTDVIVQKPSDIKLLSNRQIVTSGSTPKMSTPGPHGRLVTTKVIGSIPQSRATSTPVIADKMVVVSKPTLENKQVQPSTKFIVTSSVSTPTRERPFSTNPIQKISDAFTPKGIPATDLKVSAKAVVLNKPGPKMVVVPSKARTKAEGPLIHFKGMSTHMKLLPVSSQAHIGQGAKSAAVTVVSRPNTLSSSTKVISKDHSSMPIKTANLADIIPAKGMMPSTPKITNPILRPSSTKGNVIIVQKGNVGKALAFAKNGSDMSKIIMGKNVTQLMQASKTDHTEAAKSAGNVIVLELNNENSGRPTTLSEILDNRGGAGARPPADKPTPITPETPVLFDNRMAEETCNASSLDSTTESIGSAVPLDHAGITLMSKSEPKSSFSKESDNAKDSSSVTDWEIELDTAAERKDKDEDDKLNSMHLDLGMSSDSEAEYLSTGRATPRKQPRQRPTTSGERGEVYSSASAMSVATRTLLSQLQDEGSSSNDSSFALKAKISRLRETDSKLDRDSDELTKAKEKLSEKVREAKSQQKRIDVYSTAITPSDMNLDSFAYLEEGILVEDEEFSRERRADPLDQQLSQLLGDESASDDSQPVSEHMPLSK